jgi:hypothetical protein
LGELTMVFMNVESIMPLAVSKWNERHVKMKRKRTFQCSWNMFMDRYYWPWRSKYKVSLYKSKFWYCWIAWAESMHNL